MPCCDALGLLARAALDLVVPLDCVGCGQPGRSWCPRCDQAARGPALEVPGEVACRAAAAHGGAQSRAVVAFKDQGVRSLANPLAAMLAGAVRAVLADLAEPPRASTAPGGGCGGPEWVPGGPGWVSGPGWVPGGPEWVPDGPVWLVPMPSRPAARRQRGFDHMDVLASRAARHLRRAGIPAHRCRLLTHARASRDQVGLGRVQRWENVHGSLVAAPPPSGLLVLVDDVTTTGATLAEAARALRCSGTAPHAAATITWAAATLASGAQAD